jgi:hypothetical protein
VERCQCWLDAQPVGPTIDAGSGLMSVDNEDTWVRQVLAERGRVVRRKQDSVKHISAGYGVLDTNKHCCDKRRCNACLGIGTPNDWRPFTTWRPWQNPPAEAVKLLELILANSRSPSLPVALQKILYVHRSTFQPAPYNDKKRLHYYDRDDSGRRRFELRSWVNGRPYARMWLSNRREFWTFDDRRYVKFWECKDTNKIVLDHTLVRRERPTEKKMPGYKLHVSWRVVMEHTGCSRATAFRKIAEGWTLADCTCGRCVEQQRRRSVTEKSRGVAVANPFQLVS